MALNYLLSPEFQIVNSAGRPASGGFLEVFHHGTRDRYYCASDFNGTLHPFQVPLDSLGGNVVLADDSHAYDVYIYNRYGSLLMSRYNVHPSSGGSMGGVITSSDGSVKVTPTQDGWDLSVDDGKASTFRAAADSLTADGYFSFRKIEGEGEAIYLDNGAIKMDDGWYHFSATVKLSWYGSNVNDTSTVRLYSGATYDVIDFDYSYNHSDTVVLDGDIWIGAHSTHYISFGRNFSLGVTGMRQGMVAELVDCDLHSIIGQGVGGNGEKNIHRLLRYYTNANEADAQHPAGDWLHDLDAEDPEDPSGHPMVTADQLFDWYDEGQIFDLYEVDGSNGQLGWSAVYRMVTWQDQSAWWSQDAPVPGKACRLEFYRMGGYSSVNRGMMIAYIRYKEEDYMRLYQIMPGQDVWTMDFQPELTAGSNISISGSTISATDTTYTAGTGLSLAGTEFSADTSVLATQSDLAGKQDTLTAGSNITISNNVISATDTTYTAGSGIDITGDVISADTSVVATQSDLAGKQDTLTAGTGITIQNNVISATAAQQVQADWTETDTSDPSYIQNKPTLATVATTGDYDDLTDKPSIPTKTSDLTNDSGFITVSDIPAQVQSDWTESDSSDPSYIQNKPDLSIYAESANLATVATTGDYSDLANKPSIPTVDQVYDGTSTNAQSGTAVAEAVAGVDTGLFVAQYGVTTFSQVVAAIEAKKIVYCRIGADWNDSRMAFLAYDAHTSANGNVEFQYVRSNSNSSGTDSIFVYKLYRDNRWETTERTLKAGNISYPVTRVNVNGASAMTGTVANITIPAQVQSNWSESDSSSVSYIQNKPSNLVQDASYVHTDENFTSAEKTKLAGIEANAEVNVQSDWNESDSSSDAYIQNKPQNLVQDASYVHTDENFTSAEKTKLAGIEENAEVNVQSDWNESDSSSDAYIKNKPSIPTKTSDLQNDSGFITSSDIPAQVQADWTESDSSDSSYIQNKPNLAAVAVSGDYGDLLNKPTINNVPAVTSSDNDKVLKATYSGGVGSYSWEVEQGTTYSAGDGVSIDQNNVISAKVDGSTITTNSSGELTANIPSQVQSDWTESDTTDPSYIQNKPTEKTLVAGSNITITEDTTNVTISATDTTYSAGTGIDITSGVVSVDTSVVATQADLATKQDTLTAGTNVSISNNVISATDTTYSAGTGIDITNNEISVETPVDIVAGPGIVIDNPDGNTLRVSTDEDYEVTLFENATAVTSGSLSETPANFEYIKVYCNRTGGTTTNNLAGYTEVLTRDGVPQCFTILAALFSLSSVFQTTNVFSLSSGSFSLDKAFNVRIYSGGLEVQSQEFNNVGILKIVGIHRIQGGS